MQTDRDLGGEGRVGAVKIPASSGPPPGRAMERGPTPRFAERFSRRASAVCRSAGAQQQIINHLSGNSRFHPGGSERVRAAYLACRSNSASPGPQTATSSRTGEVRARSRRRRPSSPSSTVEGHVSERPGSTGERPLRPAHVQLAMAEAEGIDTQSAAQHRRRDSTDVMNKARPGVKSQISTARPSSPSRGSSAKNTSSDPARGEIGEPGSSRTGTVASPQLSVSSGSSQKVKSPGVVDGQKRKLLALRSMGPECRETGGTSTRTPGL